MPKFWWAMVVLLLLAAKSVPRTRVEQQAGDANQSKTVKRFIPETPWFLDLIKENNLQPLLEQERQQRQRCAPNAPTMPQIPTGMNSVLGLAVVRKGKLGQGLLTY